MFVGAKAVGTIFYPQGHGVWVPAFAGTTGTNVFAPLRYDAFLILKLAR